MSAGKGAGPAAFEAAIFDMDGLLVDSEPLWRQAEQEVFAGVGLELDDAMCEATMGQRTDQVVAYWYGVAPWRGPTPREVEDRITRRVKELIRDRGRPMPGVFEVLAALRADRLALALASSSCPELIAAVLAKLGLEGAFDVVCSAVDEERGKPDPAVFLRAARELGVPPERCLVFEDSVAGVAAGRAAGMYVIAVPDPKLADAPGFAAADLRLRSLRELPWPVLGRGQRPVAGEPAKGYP